MVVRGVYVFLFWQQASEVSSHRRPDLEKFPRHVSLSHGTAHTLHTAWTSTGRGQRSTRSTRSTRSAPFPRVTTVPIHRFFLEKPYAISPTAYLTYIYLEVPDPMCLCVSGRTYCSWIRACAHSPMHMQCIQLLTRALAHTDTHTHTPEHALASHTSSPAPIRSVSREFLPKPHTKR